MRLRNRDIQELSDMASVGDEVELLGERTPEMERIFGQTIMAQAAAADQ